MQRVCVSGDPVYQQAPRALQCWVQHMPDDPDRTHLCGKKPPTNCTSHSLQQACLWYTSCIICTNGWPICPLLRTSLSTHTIPPQRSQTLALHMDPNVHGLSVLLYRLQYWLPSWWLSHLMLVRLDCYLHHWAGSFLKAAGGWGSFLDYNQEATPSDASDAFSSQCQCSGELLTLFFFSSFADHKDSAVSLAHQAVFSSSCPGW